MGWMWEQVSPLFEWLGEQFEPLAEWIVDKFIDLLLFCIDLIADGFEWFFGLLEDVIPESFQLALEPLGPFFGVLRAYVPVEYAATLIAASFAIQGIVVSFKFLLKVKQMFNPLG